MTLRYGTDTSVLMRLLTGHPEDEYQRCRQGLGRMVEEDQAEIFASNQVIGEAYIALQHHYGISKPDARQSLTQVLTSGLIGPLNGQPVLIILSGQGGAGPLDRLIADDYSRQVYETLTLDRRMARLPQVGRL